MLSAKLLLTCLPIIVLINFGGKLSAQCKEAPEIWDEIQLTENNKELTIKMKMAKLIELKKHFENCKLPIDSVYARILHRLGLYEYLSNGNTPTPASINHTLQSARINISNLNGSPKFAVNSYSNVAIYYKKLRLYKQALMYFDTTIFLANKYPDQYTFFFTARQERSNIFFQTGYYQQSIDEAYAGFLKAKNLGDTTWMIALLNQMAQSHFAQNELLQGLDVANKAIAFSNSQLDQISTGGDSNPENKPGLKRLYFDLSTAFKTKALVYEQMGNLVRAEEFFQKTIKTRMKSVTDGNFGQVAGDYIDFGNLHLNSDNFKRAYDCYSQALRYAKHSEDYDRTAKAYLNLGQAFAKQGNYKLAEYNYLKSINQLTDTSYSNFFQQPTAISLSRIVNNEFILVFLRNRLELLVILYNKTKEVRYVDKALQTALLCDTIVSQFRHEQTGEQSRLFWRNHTNDIYALAIETAYLNNNAALAFFFMEKSRAVLLNDKLNELGSSAYLPLNEAAREQELRNKLSQLLVTAPSAKNENEREEIDLKTLQAKDTFARYIKSLENKYPTYYQYKYDDDVPSLQQLQKYLAANRQGFVHYFMGDTVSYVLGISENKVRMLRIDKSQFQFTQITELLQFFSDKQLLNNRYANFVSLSNSLNKHLFEPLQLPKGRVVICPDNFLLPFEALCTDKQGTKMLIEDYAFSYIYSARYLLKQFPQDPAKGNFLGFAPVSFQSYLHLADLKNSAHSLDNAADNYYRSLIYTSTQATKHNFLSTIGNYSIVNIFSHARADEGDDQPVLYMQDSVIRLSELQYLNRPSTRLVVLSACQTTAGKNATGEGIYSLARGFAAAGIPAVAATIWKADEETTYSISILFHRFLSKGMRKDEALQKAKLTFMKEAGREQTLPYYWANMIIIGNVDPLLLQEKNNTWIWVTAALMLLSVGIGLMIFRWRSKNAH